MPYSNFSEHCKYNRAKYPILEEMFSAAHRRALFAAIRKSKTFRRLVSSFESFRTSLRLTFSKVVLSFQDKYRVSLLCLVITWFVSKVSHQCVKFYPVVFR